MQYLFFFINTISDKTYKVIFLFNERVVDKAIP